MTTTTSLTSDQIAENAASVKNGGVPFHSIEARRLELLVELEQLLVELSGFLDGFLASDPSTLERAVSVRAAIAFGDWPPTRLEDVPR